MLFKNQKPLARRSQSLARQNQLKIKNGLVFFVVFNSLCLWVLGNTPDSLENVLKRTTSDTEKAMIYNSFARDLLTGQSRDYYETVQYAQQGRINQNYHQAIQYVQQGLILAEEAQFDKGRAELYRTMGSAWYYLNDYEQAIEYYQKALSICEKIEDINGVAMNYYNISLVYQTQQTKIYYQLENLQKALSIWKQLGNTNNMARAYDMTIQLYQSVGDWQLANACAEEALSLALETGNRIEEASLYELLAKIHFSMGNVEVQEEYYKKSLHILEELGDELRIARMTGIIADEIYSNYPATAIALLRKSIAIYERISPKNAQLFEVYNILADQFQAINNNDSTRYYKEKALSKAILSENLSYIAMAYNITGKFYMDDGDINRAEKDFQKAYDIAVKSGLYTVLSNALSGLSSVNYRKGNYKTAIGYLQKFQTISDSLNREENEMNVQQLTMQYAFEKDKVENTEIIKAQLERQQQDMKHQNTIMMIFSLALICTTILAVFIIRSNKLINRANLKLGQQHREILRINNALQESHQELSGYRDSLEQMVREQTVKLQQSEMRLRTLSDNLARGCIYRKYVFHDGKQFISYISNTAEKWLGLSAEIIMSDIDNFYRQMIPEDIEKKQKLERESISSMSSYSFEYRMMKGDEEVWLLENAMPRAEKNQTIVWDAIVVDITDHKKFEKELIQAKELAEDSDRLKSAFLANMSHEIRTPMNGIVGFLNFVEREDMTVEKRLVYTGIIRTSAQQLLKLIDDIIDISKMDSNQLALSQVPFDLNTLMDELEIFSINSILKRNKKLELTLDHSRFVLPCIIKSDPVRIQQILSNLIGNAVKFTEKGYIRFGYRLTECNEKLYFFVEDTGIGVHESKQEYIFERFRQAYDDKTNTMYGGTGLGLAISKSLVEMMGGRIGVKSEVGMGSTFYFTLPYCPVG